jgi:phosphopantothenoylcysteine synthetase/decarboxylase
MDGFKLIGPEEGWQACRTVGAGRMSEPEEILGEIAKLLRPRA